MTKPFVTAERLRELFNYNPETGVFTRLVSVSDNAKAGDIAGTMNSGGYMKIVVCGRLYQSHRLAWLYVYGRWPAHEIDHINGIRTDNRIENLRDVIPSTNKQNQRNANSNNKLGLLGVTRRSQGFHAQIRINGKCTYLGTFPTGEQAHAAYLDAKRKNHSGYML